jgi:type IV pilus assembly protein PilQ
MQFCWPLFLVLLVACQTTETKRATATAPPAKAVPSSAANSGTSAKASTNPSSRPPSGKVAVSPVYDAELRAIVDLARHNQWDEAESRASALYALDPRDSSVQRVYNFVQTEGPKRREKAVEDQIREVTASQDTRFNPTLGSLLKEKKSSGLPPRSDLREAIEKIKATPYIPENFGKTIQSKGTLEDYRSEKGQMEAILEKKIEVHLDNVPLESIIFNVGQQEKINFIMDKSIPTIQQKLTANFKDVKLRNFLDYVQRNMGVQFQVAGDLIWIMDGKDTNKVQEEIRYYHLKKGFVLPAQFGALDTTKTTVTAPNNVKTETETQKFESFVRDGAPKEPAIEAAIKRFFKGKYQIDYERNLIVARGTVEQLRVLDQIYEEFDKAVQQVLIEARFVTVTEAAFLQLGALWETGRNPLTSTTATPTDFTGLGPANVGLGLQGTWMGVLGRKDLSATVSALDQSGESETLSAPRLTVINNLPAVINDGTKQYYYEEYRVAQTILQNSTSSTVVPTNKPVFIVAGVVLDVMASIGNDGKSITLALNPEVTENVQLVTFASINSLDSQGRLASTFGIKLPQYRKQSLATRVVVKSGQTVVMGGVVQEQRQTFVEGVPILSRIPLLGAAFRRRTESNMPRYLLVFVTATLLSENGEFIISADAE